MILSYPSGFMKDESAVSEAEKKLRVSLHFHKPILYK